MVSASIKASVVSPEPGVPQACTCSWVVTRVTLSGTQETAKYLIALLLSLHGGDAHCTLIVVMYFLLKTIF